METPISSTASRRSALAPEAPATPAMTAPHGSDRLAFTESDASDAARPSSRPPAAHRIVRLFRPASRKGRKKAESDTA